MDMPNEALRPKRTEEIARDLRAFAGSDIAPAYAAKLRAIAAELEALAAPGFSLAAE